MSIHTLKHNSYYRINRINNKTNQSTWSILTTWYNIIIRHIYIWPMFSEPRHVYAWNGVGYRFINVIIKIIEDYIAAFLWKCVYLSGDEIWNIELCLVFKCWILYPLFLHYLGELNENLSSNILYLMFFTFKLAKQKMTSKITSFLFFC